MADKADFAAINEYLMTTPIINSAAEKIKQDWMAWWHSHNNDWYYTEDDYNHARNTRNQFNIANTATPAEQAEVKAQIATGVTTEEMKGQTKTAGTTGMFYEEPKPLIPTKWKVFGLITAGVIGAGYVVKKAFAHTPLGAVLTKLF